MHKYVIISKTLYYASHGHIYMKTQLGQTWLCVIQPHRKKEKNLQRGFHFPGITLRFLKVSIHSMNEQKTESEKTCERT